MLGKTSKSKRHRQWKKLREQEPENLRLVLYDRESSISPWYQGRGIKSELQSKPGASTATSTLPWEAFWKSTSPAHHLRSDGSAVGPGICFGLIWFLAFPNDSDPQLSFGLPETKRAPLGSNHLRFPEPLWRQPSSTVRSFPLQLSPNLALSVFVLFFWLCHVACGILVPHQENPNLELGAWSLITGPPGSSLIALILFF